MDTLKINKPVYDYLGYRILEFHLDRASDDLFRSIEIKALESTFFEEEDVYQILVEINAEINEEDGLNIVFDAGFSINDREWLGKITKVQVTSLFFSIVFPFIRETVATITHDVRGSFNIPILDMRQIDLLHGVTFSLLEPNESNQK